MSGDLKDILSNLNPDIDQETLLQYLQGKLTPEKQHEIEKQMIRDDFDADALEGLSGMQDKAKIQLLVDQLNLDLKKKTTKKNQRKKELGLQPWIIISIIIILVLIVISYVIIYLYTRQN